MEAPPPLNEDIRKRTLLLRLFQCIDHSDPANLLAEIQQLNHAREVVLQLIDDLSIAQLFTPEHCVLMELASGNLERLEIEIAELNTRVQGIREQFTSRICNAFMSHLIRARLLEANNARTAQFLNWMQFNWGWQGVCCFQDNLEMPVQEEIVRNLGVVPYRLYWQVVDDGLEFGPIVHVQQNQNQNQ